MLGRKCYLQFYGNMAHSCPFFYYISLWFVHWPVTTCLLEQQKNKTLFAGKRVGIIFSSGNVELKKLGDWF